MAYGDGAGEAAVELVDAEARLGRRVVWSGVSLSVPRGELVAILGPNGAGKSTLLRALLGLQPLSHGQARVLGGRPGARNDLIGYLPQRRVFDETVRIRGVDIVRLGIDGARWGVPLPGGRWLGGRSRRTAAHVERLIDLVGAERFARRPIAECSGGEQQRLLIAQALGREPRLLLLDEPLDGLDLPNQTAVVSLLRDISRYQGVTVLLVAHDVNPLLPHIDRVVYLAGGRAAVGSPQEVISSETLSSLYGAPIEVLRTAGGRLVVVGQPDAPHAHGARHSEGAPSGLQGHP